MGTWAKRIRAYLSVNDAVNKPSHYQLFADGTQSIDVIRRALTPEEFVGFCKGNCLKYRLRAGKKDALEQDIAKAGAYANMLEDYLKPEPTPDKATNAEALAFGLNLLNASCHEQRVKCGDDRRHWGCLDCLASDCESV